MNSRITAAALSVLLAASGLFLSPETKAPNSIEAARLNNIGCAYMNQQLFEKGLNLFKQAAEADPKFAIARLNEGVAYLNLQKIDQAKAALEEALKQDPKNPNAWYSLGLLAKNTGDAPSSIEAFKRVTEIDANDADTWYFLGTAYVQAKQFQQAIDAFQHALQINSLHASAEFGLSRAYQQSADVDHAREHLKKFQYITQNKIGAPMSLAYGEQGQYSRAMESPQGQLKPLPQIKVRFVDVTKEAGIVSRPTPVVSVIKNESLGPGACFFDYDSDGKPDLFIASNGPEGGLVLYHNLGKGKFEDVTKQAGLDPGLDATSCTAGDYDNDGFTDLAVGADAHVLLLHNEKGRTFLDQSAILGTKPAKSGVAGLTFVDYDHDGDLDLYAAYVGMARDTTKLSQTYVAETRGANQMWRNNGDGTFTDDTDARGLSGPAYGANAIGTDYNNDRAVDLVVTGGRNSGAVGGTLQFPATIFENQREGKFSPRELVVSAAPPRGVVPLDFDHDGWMDLAFTHAGAPALTLWRNNHGKSFEQVKLPETNWVRAFGVAAFDYDNDGWVDLVAVGETKDGKGEIKLFRNLGPDGFKDVTADVGLDKIQLKDPRAIITGDYDNDGATDLLITQNHGPAVLLRNEGATQNHWLKLSLKGLADNKSAIGTKVEVFAGGNRQKFEIAGSNGYLGQNSTDIVVGLGESKEADIVRMLWPTGVLQDETPVAGDKQQNFLEVDRRGSSCPTLFAWNGERYEFVADMLGAGVVGHWVGPGQRDIPRPVEWIKIPTGMVREKDVRLRTSDLGHNTSVEVGSPRSDAGLLSFRFMEPLEEAVYLDQVRLLAVDHPANEEVYPNEYFASNPPYPPFKVVVSRDARPPAGAWDEHGHDVLPDLLAHRLFRRFRADAVSGICQAAQPHARSGRGLSRGAALAAAARRSRILLGKQHVCRVAGRNYGDLAVRGGAGRPRPVEARHRRYGIPRGWSADDDGRSDWKAAVGHEEDSHHDQSAGLLGQHSGRPHGAVRPVCACPTSGTMLKLPDPRASRGESESPSQQPAGRRRYDYRLTPVPLAHADLEFHGYPFKIEGTPAGNVQYIYEKTSATGPYTRPFGTYTRYGDVLPLLTATDDKLAVFGSGDEVRLDFDPSHLPALPKGWVRDYFFAANGYEKDMDFYAAEGNFVAPLPFLSMGEYPYSPKKSFPLDDAHVNYLLEYNTRHMSGNEQRGYWFDYGDR